MDDLLGMIHTALCKREIFTEYFGKWCKLLNLELNGMLELTWDSEEPNTFIWHFEVFRPGAEDVNRLRFKFMDDLRDPYSETVFVELGKRLRKWTKKTRGD